MALLQQGSRREGLLDAEPISRVAARVVSLEESAFEPGADAWPEEKCTVHGSDKAETLTRERNGYPV